VADLVMFDAIDLNQIPVGPAAVGAYVNGLWPTAETAPARFPHARILTIAVSPDHDAEALDVETGDAKPHDAPAWYERQKPRVQRPCLYASVDLMQAEVIPVLQAAGIPRADVRLWTAHYAGKHICGPLTCGEISTDADGTQWTDQAFGRDLDQSLLLADFFGTPPAPKPAPSPVPAWQEAMLNKLPTLSEGAEDKAGEVFFVHRAQALVHLYGQITGLADAASQMVTGNYESATAACVRAVQGHVGITADGVVGPQTWSVLVTGSAS